MSEIAKFVHHGAAKVTSQILKNVHKQLPLLKVEFAQINAPKFPHLVDQLEFLADVVEDFAEGAGDELPLVTVAQAVFALVYCHKKLDLIPDSNPDYGYADDSAVVRCVLIENERVLEAYAKSHGLKWSAVTIKP
jgi:uncharacterized membrane protein YkvA (DUF1232 family)